MATSVSVYGPEPASFCEMSVPLASAVGLIISPGRCARTVGSAASGAVRLIVTSYGPLTVTPETLARKPRTGDSVAASVRSMLTLTASASNGVPSWNVTSSRSFRSSPSPSGVNAHSVASIGSTSSVGDRRRSPS